MLQFRHNSGAFIAMNYAPILKRCIPMNLKINKSVNKQS